MNRMKQYVAERRKYQPFQQKQSVVNYMAGIYYCWNPLDTLCGMKRI